MFEGFRDMQNLMTWSRERMGDAGEEEYRRIEYGSGRQLQPQEFVSRVKEEEAARMMFMLSR